MSLLHKIAQATPELISAAGDGANDLIISPNPSLVSTLQNVSPYLGIAVFGIVAVMAVITLWQTIKLYKPTILHL